MTAALTALHVFVCIFLIAVVLLQRGKGAEVGAVFGGGGGATVFGSRGAGNFLTKLTTGSAVVFMLTSLSLSYFYAQESGDTLFDDAALEGAAGAGATEGEGSLFDDLGEVDINPGGAGDAAGATAADAVDAARAAGADALEAAESAAGAAADAAAQAASEAGAAAKSALDAGAAEAGRVVEDAKQP